MTDPASSYSYSQGVQLLERMLQAFGPIFSLEQISSLPDNQNLSAVQIRKLISKLAQSGWVEILKRGTYVVKSPLYTGDIPAFGIAAALVQPIAISHWSALAHHGFTTQNPRMIQATTPHKVITPEMRSGNTSRPRGRATWHAFGLEFEFISSTKERFWGFKRIWVNAWQQVEITDPERTALDLIIRPDIFGGIGAASEILEENLSKIDIPQLVNYALRYDMRTVIKRLGWLLEKMDVNADHIHPLQSYPARGTILLDVNKPKGESYNSRWQIYENLKGD
jgi:predicted transcriptional regulator of viral defense system